MWFWPKMELMVPSQGTLLALISQSESGDILLAPSPSLPLILLPVPDFTKEEENGAGGGEEGGGDAYRDCLSLLLFSAHIHSKELLFPCIVLCEETHCNKPTPLPPPETSALQHGSPNSGSGQNHNLIIGGL